MPLPIPFFSGKDATWRLFVNGSETILNAKSCTVSADVTKVQDGVNGEDRDRPYSFINLWNWSVVCFMDRTQALDMYLQYHANNDAQVAPFDTAGGANFKLIDGTKKNYVMKEATVDDMQMQNTDRKDRVMVTINGRGRYFDAVASL